ncbi:MAG: carbamoyltransferase HypF [Sulfurimonas sp.]
MKNYHIMIQGTVQGVGFRPFLYRLAKKLHINGKIWNSHRGVEMFVQTSPLNLEAFLTQLKVDPPSLSQIDDIHCKRMEEEMGFAEMTIDHNEKKEGTLNVITPLDTGICKKCKEELFDPSNRRYLYPFISCTECGPRYTLLKALPYERAQSSMNTFPLCKKCREEYENPDNRRFHAQGISCPECGPKITLYDHDRKLSVGARSLERITEALSEGKIIAMKGVGGFHLICDATDTQAVTRLRKRKKRPLKPFAVMVKEMSDAKKLIKINRHEESLLRSSQKPILIAQLKEDAKLSTQVAPKIDKLGVMLAYTPLQLILLARYKKPIVVTSANVSDAPICAAFEEIKAYHHLWDLCLDHDLEIHHRCDDSVVMSVDDKTVLLRSARGYAPTHFRLPHPIRKKTLSTGSNQKNTIAISFKDQMITSPHIGDLVSVESIEHFEKSLHAFESLYHFSPDRIVCDQHPLYESTKWTKRQNDETVQVQHHKTHIASAIFEHNLKEEILGVAFDGSGYGDDGKIWGGEFFRGKGDDLKRIGHFRYFRLLGGESAIKEPRKIALSLLFSLYGKVAVRLKNPTTAAFTQSEMESLYLLYEKGINTPLSSSAGRLFDAIASLTDICQKISYEGESGLRMESFFDASITKSYPFEVINGEINWSMMIEGVLEEKNQTQAVSKFFNTLVEIICYFYQQERLKVIVGGGVFQNKTLLGLLSDKIEDLYWNEKVPLNDGGVSMGQLALVREKG